MKGKDKSKNIWQRNVHRIKKTSAFCHFVKKHNKRIGKIVNGICEVAVYAIDKKR